MLTEKQIKRIKECIDKHCYLKYNEKNDCYYGEIYPCKQDIFEATYEEVKE